MGPSQSWNISLESAQKKSYLLENTSAASLQRSGVLPSLKPAALLCIWPLLDGVILDLFLWLGLKIVAAEPSVLGSISLLKRVAAVAELKPAPVKKVNNLSAFLHPMSVP